MNRYVIIKRARESDFRYKCQVMANINASPLLRPHTGLARGKSCPSLNSTSG